MQQQIMGHEKWMELIRKLLDMTLSEDQAQELDEHLKDCESCFSVYAQLMEEQFVEEHPKGSLYLTERSSWGTLAWSPEEQEEWAEEISFQALLQEQGKKPIVIKHTLYQEMSTHLMLLRVRTKLQQEGRAVHLFPSAAEVFLEPSQRETNGKPSYLIIPHAPSHPDFLEKFEQLASHDNQVIIASGRYEEWDGAFLPFDHVSYALDPDLFERERFESKLREEVARQIEGLSQREGIRQAYLWVCLLDAFGIPTPVSLLAKLMDREKEAVYALLDDAQGFILPVKTDGGKSLVSTEGEAIAQEVVRREFGNEEDRIRKYREIIQAAEFEEHETILRLFHRMARRGQRLFVQALLKEQAWCEKKLEVFTSERASSRELLYWGKTLGENRLFKEAQRVFEKGLARDRENIYLLQAYAKMLADQGEYDKAKEFFTKACDRNRSNVYVWQAWGDMERKRGEQEGLELAAEKYDEILKNLDPNNLHALISYGHLMIAKARESRPTSREIGEDLVRQYFEDAEARFQRAQQIDPGNVYAQHSLGILEHRRGDYQRAEQHFRRALLLDPNNVPTLHAMGMIAKERGHWQEAERYFQDALSIDPKNIETLHALGELKADQGKYREAKEYFDKVLDLDSRNLHTYVAFLAMEGKRGNFVRAKEWYNSARDLFREDNDYLRGAWAEVLAKQGEYREAESEIFAIWRQAKGLNAPTLNIYAKMKAEQGIFDNAAEPKVFDEAKGALERSIQLDPGNVITRNTWADVEMRWAERESMNRNPEKAREHLEEARKHLQKAFEIDQENVYTRVKREISQCGMPIYFESPAIYFCWQHELLPHVTAALKLIKECFPSVYSVRLEPEQDPETEDEWLSIIVTMPGEAETIFESYTHYCEREVKEIPWPLRSKFSVFCTIV